MSYIPRLYKAAPQQVAVALSGTSGSQMLTTAVDPTCSLLGFQGLVSNDITAQLGWDDFALGVITDGSTITVTKPGTGAWGLVWYGVVFEFLKFFTLRAECGYIDIPDGSSSADKTITASPNALVLCTGWSNGNSTPSGSPSLLESVIGSIVQVNSTTLRATRNGSAVSGTSLRVGYSLWAPKG